MPADRLSVVADCGGDCYATLSCLTPGAYPLSGVVTLRLELPGAWARRDAPALVENTVASAVLHVDGVPWLAFTGHGPSTRYDQHSTPPWWEWDADTRLLSDGEHAAILQVFKWQSDPNNPGGLYTGFLPAGVARFAFSTANGQAARALVPDLCEIVREPGQPADLPACKELLCDGSPGGATQGAAWAVAAAPATDEGGGIRAAEVSDSLGRRGSSRLCVRSLGGVPHFLRGGGVSAEWVEGRSFVAVSLMPMPGDRVTGPWFWDGVRAMGVNAAGVATAPRGPWNFPDLAAWKADVDRHHAQAVADNVEAGFQLAIAADDVVWVDAVDWYVKHPDHLRYVAEKTAATGAAAYWRGRDETSLTIGPDPKAIGPGHRLYDPAYSDFSWDGLRRFAEIWRSVPGAPPMLHAGGGDLWADPEIADGYSGYTLPLSPDSDPEGGPSPGEIAATWRRGNAGDPARGWAGTPARCPREALLIASGDNYWKMVPGERYQPGRDVLKRGGIRPQSMTAQIGLAVVYQFAALAFYFPDDLVAVRGRRDAPLSRPGVQGGMVECQTGLVPSSPTYRAAQVALGWLHQNARRVLARPVDCRSIGPDWEACARDDGPGARMALAVNVSGRTLPLPPVPNWLPFLENADVVTPERATHPAMPGEPVPDGCFAAWRG